MKLGVRDCKHKLKGNRRSNSYAKARKRLLPKSPRKTLKGDFWRSVAYKSTSIARSAKKYLMTQFRDLASILFAVSVSRSGWTTKSKPPDSARIAARPCAETRSRRIFYRSNYSMSLWSSAPIGRASGKGSWRMSLLTSLTAHFGQDSCQIGSIGISLREKRNLNADEQLRNLDDDVRDKFKLKKCSRLQSAYSMLSDLSWMPKPEVADLIHSSAVWSKEVQTFSQTIEKNTKSRKRNRIRL